MWGLKLTSAVKTNGKIRENGEPINICSHTHTESGNIGPFDGEQRLKYDYMRLERLSSALHSS